MAHPDRVRNDLGDGTIYTDLHDLLSHLRACLLELEEKVGALDQRRADEDDQSDD